MTMTAPPASLPQALETRGINWSKVLGIFGPLLGLAFVFALFAIMVPIRTSRQTFLTQPNLEVMLVQTTVVATAALGMTIIIISGGIDLSVGSNIALITVTVATLLAKGWPAPLAALGGIVMAMIVGMVMGTLVTSLRISPFIVSLGLWRSVRGVAKEMADQQTVNAPDTWLNGLLSSGNRILGFPAGVWIMLVLAIVVACMLRYTRFGRHIFAIGSNEQTARLCGVSLTKTKILIYITAALFFGVAGVLQFAYLTVGDPTTANGMELDIIAAVVIGGASLNGGQGSVLGSIIGALIMTVLANGSTKMGWSNSLQEIITGGIIILAVALDSLRQRRAAA
jgi:ribose transport system permease protein